MKSLMNKTTQQTLIPRLEVADTFKTRGVGLLGRHSLASEEALWIHHCNSIHTFFMKFSIDCVFVTKDLVVDDLVENVTPWKVVFPRWKSRSVFELPSGAISKANIKKGDQLDVVS